MPDLDFALVYIICLILAGIIGFTIRRASTCAVAAVSEMVLKKRFRRFMSFLLCSAVVTVIVMPAVWLLESQTALLPAFAPSWTSLAGGALFGLGAYLNGTCNFGTINKLGGGDMRYLFLFPGLFAGALLGRAFSAPDPIPAISPVHEPSLFSFAWLIACIILIISATVASIEHKRERGTPGQPVAYYMALMGGLTALITIALGPWHYTHIAVIGSEDWAATTLRPIAIMSGLLVASILGAAVTAVRAKRFKLTRPTLPGALSTLAGGVLMGLAILLIPGGNDGIVMSGIPSFSQSALLAYAAMCLTIALLVWLPKRLNPAPTAN